MDESATLFLCGDVMTGRGIDQILPHPCDPDLHEPHVKIATAYRELAEAANGPIPHPVPFDYIWGDALEEMERIGPDLRIVNLETAVTRSHQWWRDKMIHYRMSPENAGCLSAAGIDACSLANNHVLDWGYPGLLDTRETLRRLDIATAGAGRNLAEAQAPAILEIPGRGRVLLFCFGSGSSGIPREWGAEADRPGVNFLPDLSMATAREIGHAVWALKQKGDIAVASVHWGGNWGYRIPSSHRLFARALIDEAGIDLVHGHSSHHAMGIEVYREKLVLYGCGDLLTDYEGISGFEDFRGDLGLMYFPTLTLPGGRLKNLRMVPTAMRKLRLSRPFPSERKWLQAILDREGKGLGVRVKLTDEGDLVLVWR